jgi:hypothetical protein
MFYSLNLTQRPPRSPRTRLGGYAILPRMLDKCRAEIAGTAGEYHYACPVDERLLTFAGLDADAVKAEVAKGGGDGAILAWILEHRRNQHTPAEIEEWSREQDERKPDAESMEFFQEYLAASGPGRTDITTWSDLLDLDDYVSFGGRP